MISAVEQFVTAPDAARMLKVTPSRVHQLIADGLLKEVTRAGRTVMLERAAVERLARDGWPGRRSPPKSG
jgi:hypothetical protein